MDLDYETNMYEYSLNIMTVKMQVNFPCKMKVQFNSVPLTTEVQSNGLHKFIFNQEITVRQELQKQSFELQISLVTDKGAKYTAGILKLFHNELIRSQGERIVVALARCLDKEAFCEMKVDKVLKSIVSKRSTFGGRPNKPVPLPNFDTQDVENNSPTNNRMTKNKGAYGMVAQTKSQFQFPINNTRSRNNVNTNNNNLNIDWDAKSREVPQSYYQRNASKSPNTRTNFNRSRVQAGRSSLLGGKQRGQRFVTQMPEDIEIYNRDKLIEAEVYKEQYIKLKEKYKKQAQTAKNELNKRIELQNNENSLKLEVMKYKLKTQDLERSSNDKTMRIKQLQNQLAVLQQRQMEINYLKTDLQQKEHNIRVLEDTIRQINHENEQIKAINQNRYTQEHEKINELKHELENNKNKYESKLHQLEKDLKASQSDLNSMEKQLISLNNDLEQQRNSSAQIESTLQQKTYEFQRSLQQQKTANQHNLEDLYTKLQRIEKQLTEKQHAYKQLHKENEKFKTMLMKLQYDKKILTQDNDALKSEYHDVKIYKEKYNQIFRDYKMVIEDKKMLEKQLEKTIMNKDSNLQEMNVQYNDQIEYYKKVSRQMDERSKAYSNKIIEMEGQMDIIKGQAEKIRRNNENLIKDLSEAKEKEKQAKKALKIKEQEILSLEAEYSTIRQKSKNVDQIFKLETDKLKEEIEKLKIDLENEFIKCSQLSQSNTDMAMELSKIRVKLQFTQERLQKDTSSMKDRQLQLQGLIKDYEMQISSLQDTINSLRQEEKQLTSSLNRTQMELLRSEENSDKRHRQIKSLEEKLMSVENFVKVKEQEINNLQYEREQLQKRVNELENDITTSKNEGSTLNSQKNKGLKIIQIYEEDLKKAKYDINSLTTALEQKEKQYEDQRSQAKHLKEELMKSELRYSTLKKQTDRFRESLTESLNGSFLPIFESLPIKNQSSQPSDDLSFGSRMNSWLNGIDLQRNKKPINEITTWTEIVSLIISQSKDIKLLLNRLFEQLKHLHRETQRLTEEQSLYTTKHQSSQFHLQQTINQLQSQLSQLLTQKQEEVIKFDHIIQELNNNIKQKENQLNDLNQEMQELHFTLSSINLDYTQANQSNSKKIQELKKQKNQLEQKVEEICGENIELEDVIERLKVQLEQLQVDLLNSKAMGQQQALQLQQLHEMLTSHEATIEELKRAKKSLIEQISSLQLHLASESQLKGKTQALLIDEERKSQQLKDFTNNLMKQKENAIKSDLTKAEQIIILQTTNIQLQRDKEILNEENERHKRTIEEQKEQYKNLLFKIKELQSQIGQEKSEKSKLLEKIKEKERQLQQQAEFIKKIQNKHEKLLEKFKSDKVTLESELEEKHEQLNLRIQQSNEKLLLYEKTLHEKESKVLSLENTIAQLQEQLLAKRNFIDKLQQQLTSTGAQLQSFKQRIQSQSMTHQQMLEEIKEKEENMFELSGKMYNLQLKISTKETELKTKLEELDNEWIQKYESICSEYEQRLELIEKERDYFKGVIQEKQQEIKAVKSQTRTFNQEELNIKKTLQDKIKKLEEDRLQLFTLKTNEIQKLNDQNKRITDLLRQKESEFRRLSNQLDIARASITKMQEKNKDFEEKLKNINKVYSVQLEQLKKKEQAFKGYKEWIVNQQWAMEREVRKLMQSFIKRFLEAIVVDEKASAKMVEMVKGFENTVIDAVTNKLQEQ